jgi:hypothetical protein
MVQFHCSCGTLLRAKPELAGRRIKCPHCQAAQVVPQSDEESPASAEDAPGKPAEVIHFACECGKQLTAKIALAGKRTKCPACGEMVNIPEAEESEASEEVRENPGKSGTQSGKRSAKLSAEGEAVDDAHELPRDRRKKERDADEEEENHEARPRKRKRPPGRQKSASMVWIAIVGGVVLVAGGATAIILWPRGGGSEPGTHKSKRNIEPPAGLFGRNGRQEPATTKEGRWILALSNDGFTIKGSTVRVGRVSKTELEQIIGPADRVVDLNRAERVALWDKTGIRAYFSKYNGIVRCLDCCYVVGIGDDEGLDPKKAFDSVFQIEGVEISKGTSKKTLQDSGRISQKISDHAVFPGFSIMYGNYHVDFLVSDDRKTLLSLRITYRPSHA